MMMYVFIGTGFTGALTLVFLFRILLRRMGYIAAFNAYFSPKGGCQDAIVKEIKAARKEILVQAYSFTADPLTYGLIEAKKRGVNVDIVLDKSNEVDRYSDLQIFLDNGMVPLIDGNHAISHNKVILIDRETIITGSYNFTNQAEANNAENILIIKGNPDLLNLYRANFMAHKNHSKPAQVKTPVDRHHAKAA